jgi:hypothetical protein
MQSLSSAHHSICRRSFDTGLWISVHFYSIDYRADTSQSQQEISLTAHESIVLGFLSQTANPSEAVLLREIAPAGGQAAAGEYRCGGGFSLEEIMRITAPDPWELAQGAHRPAGRSGLPARA